MKELWRKRFEISAKLLFVLTMIAVGCLGCKRNDGGNPPPVDTSGASVADQVNALSTQVKAGDYLKEQLGTPVKNPVDTPTPFKPLLVTPTP